MKLDVIYQKSCLDMSEVDSESVHLLVTSPPYNVKIVYNKDKPDGDDLTDEQYEDFTWAWIKEGVRTLVPGGRIAINVANTGRKPYKYLNRLIIDICSAFGLLPRQEFIWFKGRAAAAAKTSWGTWRDAGNPITRDCHEYIEVFNKPSNFVDSKGKPNPYRMDCTGFEKSKFLTGRAFSLDTFSVWQENPCHDRSHPAPFPEVIPRRLIEFYTRPGMTVLDPFMGSGRTAMACLKLPEKRHYIGYEVNPDFVKMALKNINKVNFVKLDEFIPSNQGALLNNVKG